MELYLPAEQFQQVALGQRRGQNQASAGDQALRVKMDVEDVR